MIFFSSLTTTKGKVLRNWHESKGKLIEYVITVTCIQPARSELIVCPRWGFRFIAAIADLVDLCFVWRAFTCRTPYCSSSWEMGTAQLQMVFSWISIMILMQYNPRKFAAGCNCYCWKKRQKPPAEMSPEFDAPICVKTKYDIIYLNISWLRWYIVMVGKWHPVRWFGIFWELLGCVHRGCGSADAPVPAAPVSLTSSQSPLASPLHW